MADSTPEQPKQAKVTITCNGETFEKIITATKGEPTNISITGTSGSFDFRKPGIPSWRKQPETADFIPLSKTPEPPNIKLLCLRPRTPKRLSSSISAEYTKVMKTVMANYALDVAMEPHENSIQSLWAYPESRSESWWRAQNVTILFIPTIIDMLNPYHMFLFEHLYNDKQKNFNIHQERAKFFRRHAHIVITRYINQLTSCGPDCADMVENFRLKFDHEVNYVLSDVHLTKCYLVSVREAPNAGKQRIDMMREGLLDPRSLGPTGCEDLKIDPIALKADWEALETLYTSRVFNMS